MTVAILGTWPEVIKKVTVICECQRRCPDCNVIPAGLLSSRPMDHFGMVLSFVRKLFRFGWSAGGGLHLGRALRDPAG